MYHVYKEGDKIMRITLEEARELYKQGSLAREIALREYTKGEILNDYTRITTLPQENVCDRTSLLFAKLYHVYRKMSEGRPMKLTAEIRYHRPVITIAWEKERPKGRTYVGKVKINGDSSYAVYVSTAWTHWDGRLGWENDGVHMGDGVLENRWAFKEKEQAEHFVKHFWKELILLELQDFYNIEFYE